MFNEKVLSFAPWSISKVNSLSICPRQYNFKYIEKQKEANKSKESRLGVLGHKVIEELLNHPEKEASDIIEVLSEEEKLSDDEKLELLIKATPINQFSDRINNFKEKNGVHTTINEHKLAIGADFSSMPFESNKSLLRGIIDYGMITKENILVIIDHKTGKKRPIAEHSTQFNAYMLLTLAAFDVDAIQCGIHYVGAKDVAWGLHRDGSNRPWLKEEIKVYTRKWLVNYLNALEPKVNSLMNKQINHKTGWQCAWCSYSDRCPEGQAEITRRQEEKNEKAKRNED